MYIEERVRVGNISFVRGSLVATQDIGDCRYVSIVHLGIYDNSEQVAVIPKVK